MKIRLIPFLISVSVSALVLLGVMHMKHMELGEHTAHKKVMVNDRLSLIAATLSQSINTRLNNTRSLAAFVKANPNFTQKEFNIFATSLQEGLVGLRSLQLAPKGIVTYITNLETNRAALGHDLFANPKRRHIVIQSVKERKLIIAGPIKLLQGGQALIARQPLFLPNKTTGKEEFWGFATVLIEVDALLADAGFFELAKEYTLAIRGIDGLGARGGVFYGDKAVFEHTIVSANVALPTGTWQIGAAIKPGHLHSGFFFSVWYWVIGGLLVLFVGISVYMITARPVQLQESVERATADLRIAKEEAEAASQAKSEFLSSMSHELRTPLNAVLGFAQMLEYNKDEPLTKSQKTYTNHIKQGGAHLFSLIENVLDLAKIEAGETQVTLENIAPNEVINECISLVETMASDRGIAISFPNRTNQHLLVRADYTRLKQVILNLLANAVKYNRVDGRVEIGITTVNGGKIRISISDIGVGIPEERYGELFLPFNRLGAERSQTPGTGIGLSISKKLVELMDGRIGFESEVGLGSTFWVELPQTEQTKTTESATESAMATTRQQNEDKNESRDSRESVMTVLYVEDNPANLALMEEIVAQIDHLAMISAHNAEFGLELARSRHPDLIILDINLPGMNGYEALKLLHERPETANTPVIALSAAVSKRDIEMGLRAGFRFYLTKPINVAEVVMTLKNILVLETPQENTQSGE